MFKVLRSAVGGPNNTCKWACVTIRREFCHMLLSFHCGTYGRDKQGAVSRQSCE